MATDDGADLLARGVTGGLPARRASTLLYAIEARTALLASRARRAMARFETERTAAEHEGQFLSALAEGRSLALRPTIQDLDRHADRWAGLVPPDPRSGPRSSAGSSRSTGCPSRRAASGRRSVPTTRSSRGVPAADRGGRSRRPGLAPLSSRERLRWRGRPSRRLESLPPFWLAFTLTLTETVGGGVLALPIAFAGFGPVGATSCWSSSASSTSLTVAALVESITRDGQMRYGNAFLGRLIGDYLGRPGLAIADPDAVRARCGRVQRRAHRVRHRRSAA